MTRRILVVDDDVIMRKLLVRSLEGLGYSAEVAVDGRSAIERIGAIAHHSFPAIDLVLLDVEMPVMDGIETLSELATSPSAVNLPVIVVSGVDDQDTVVRCLELGAVDYLHKPFDPRMLDVRVRTSLHAKQARQIELDRLERIDGLIDAARAVEAGCFRPQTLASAAGRQDELGALARTFSRMAQEVASRELALRDEVASLRIEIDGARRERQVAEVTGSDYYRRLSAEAIQLKRLLHEGDAIPDSQGRVDG